MELKIKAEELDWLIHSNNIVCEPDDDIKIEMWLEGYDEIVINSVELNGEDIQHILTDSDWEGFLFEKRNKEKEEYLVDNVIYAY